MLEKLKLLDYKTIYTAYAVRVTVFGTLSAIVAYFIGSLIPFVSPVIAAILALSAIKPTFYDTVRESIRQVVGTFFGAIFGMIFIALFGFNLLTLSIIIVIAFATGWLLRLRAEGGITIAATVILVSGPLLGDIESIEERLFGVILGTLCALVASYLIMPSYPHKRILQTTLEEGEKIGKLLKKIAKRFPQDKISTEEAENWIIEINTITDDVKNNREKIRATLKDAKWAPMLRKKDVENVVDQVGITMNNANNVRSICEAIYKAVENNATIPSKVKEDISVMLLEAAKGIKTQNKLAFKEPAEKISVEQTEYIKNKRKKLASEIKNIEDTQAILLSGTLLHETTNIKDSISVDEEKDLPL